MTSFNLDVGWVQHDSNRSTEGLRRQVLLEVGSDNTVATVGSGDLSPDDSDLGASDLLGSSVHVSDSLTQVELGVLWVGDTVNLNQRDVWVGDALRTLVGDVLTLNVYCLLVKFQDNKAMHCHSRVAVKLAGAQKRENCENFQVRPSSQTSAATTIWNSKTS